MGILLVGAVVGADQLTKALVQRSLSLHESIPVIPSIFDITYVRNTGVAFGLLASPRSPLTIGLLILFSSVAVAVLIGLWIRGRKEGRLYTMALALILGGAVGNLIDRIRLGEVIDFLDLHWRDLHWPAFNVADSSITVGVGLLLFHLFFHGDGRRKGKPKEMEYPSREI